MVIKKIEKPPWLNSFIQAAAVKVDIVQAVQEAVSQAVAKEWGMGGIRVSRLMPFKIGLLSRIQHAGLRLEKRRAIIRSLPLSILLYPSCSGCGRSGNRRGAEGRSTDDAGVVQHQDQSISNAMKNRSDPPVVRT